MKPEFKKDFTDKWKKYFGKTELPLTFYVSKGTGGAEKHVSSKPWTCFIADIAKVRKGEDLYFEPSAVKCSGAKRYLGYSDKLRPGFEYFLSCGNGKMEGERYIKTPEMVKELLKRRKGIAVHTNNLVFKRWDKLTLKDNPEVVIFFAKPDVLAGLFTLAGFDMPAEDGVITPFGAGCGSIVQYPLQEAERENPRAVIGLFDLSARPWVKENELTFAVPFKKFKTMVENMDESFLITDTWKKIKKRIDGNNKGD